MKRDKLDRSRTEGLAVACLWADVPFWWGLTERECRELPAEDKRRHFQARAGDRRRFRVFVRELAAHDRAGRLMMLEALQAAFRDGAK